MKRIVYCCNDKYFEGLYLSILSILRRSKDVYEFNILTGDFTNINKSYEAISSYHIELLNKLVKSFNSNNIITFIDCTDLYLKEYGIKDIDRYSPYSMLKLFIPQIFEGGTLLYLDTDVMANGDVAPIFNIDMTNLELCVAHDYYRKVMLKRTDSTYFNAGVWLINVSKIRETDLFADQLNISKHTICLVMKKLVLMN